MYWLIKSKKSKPKCIFKTSCSHYVYEEALHYGFLRGLKAFHFRYKNCRNGFEVFKNPISKDVQMLLPSGNIVDSKEIAERLIFKI